MSASSTLAVAACAVYALQGEEGPGAGAAGEGGPVVEAISRAAGAGAEDEGADHVAGDAAGPV